MADQYVYILSDHEDYGAEHVTATLDRSKLVGMLDANWPHAPKTRVVIVGRNKDRTAIWKEVPGFVEKAKAELAKIIHLTDEELAEKCGERSISLHWGGWGGIQLHVVKLVAPSRWAAVAECRRMGWED